MNNEIIEVQWNEDTLEYYFTCPFCGEVITMSYDGFTHSCSHLLFIYFNEEGTPFYYREDIDELIFSTAKSKGIEYLEPILDNYIDFYEEYKINRYQNHSLLGECEPIDWDAVKSEYIRNYMDESGGFRLEDFFKVLCDTKYKDSVDSFRVAVDHDDYHGDTFFVVGDI